MTNSPLPAPGDRGRATARRRADQLATYRHSKRLALFSLVFIRYSPPVQPFINVYHVYARLCARLITEATSMKLLPPLPQIGLLAAVRRHRTSYRTNEGPRRGLPGVRALMRLDTDGAESHCPNQSCEWGPSGATGRTPPQLRRDLQQNQSVNRSIVVRKHRSLASGIVLSMCSVMIAGSLWAMHARSGSTMVIVLDVADDAPTRSQVVA